MDDQNNDEELERRLRQLDAELAKTPGARSKQLQTEIELRLARLNDRDPSYYAHEPPVKLLSIKKRQSAQEETDELLKRFMEEVQLEEKVQEQSALVDEELEQRLQKLAAAAQAQHASSNPKLKKFRQTGKLIHRLMMRSFEHHDDEGDDQEQRGCPPEQLELDWCTTCNEDATVQCLDCDNDVFCKDCYRELHRDRDMRGHRTQPYQTRSKC